MSPESHSKSTPQTRTRRVFTQIDKAAAARRRRRAVASLISDRSWLRCAMLSLLLTATHFTCPSCGLPLLSADATAKTLRCTNGHSFDKAREGHVHLLPPARKPAVALQAEEDAVIRAERAFYEAGGFASQADGLAAEVARALSLCPTANDGAEEGRRQVLGAGCGEGLYLRTVREHLSRDGGAPVVGLWGTDTEKLAVRYAASRQRDAHFAVASPHDLPFADGSLDLVFAAFAPAPWEAFCRVLRPGGAVVVARAGPDHLQELRERVRGGSAVEASPSAALTKQYPAALAENYVRVRTREAFTGARAARLLEMTPIVRRAPQSCRDELEREVERGQPLHCTVDLIISTHRVWLGTGGEPM